MNTLAWLFRGAALVALAAGAVILLQQWINWLQTESWQPLSMLKLLYEARLLTTEWYIYPGSTQIVHDFLAWLPASGGLIAASPLLWAFGNAVKP